MPSPSSSPDQSRSCMRRVDRRRRPVLSEEGIRNVSSSAPLRSIMRGGKGRSDEDGVVRGNGGEVERGRAVAEREGGGVSRLGILTISSVSNVRASTTCNKEVCCKNFMHECTLRKIGNFD